MRPSHSKFIRTNFSPHFFKILFPLISDSPQMLPLNFQFFLWNFRQLQKSRTLSFFDRSLWFKKKNSAMSKLWICKKTLFETYGPISQTASHISKTNINNINNNNNNLLFMHTLLNLNRNSKVRAVSSLRTFSTPIPLTRPHPHAVRRKVIIISNCRYLFQRLQFLMFLLLCVVPTQSYGEQTKTSLKILWILL